MLGKKPEFTPATKARMLYDEDHVYVIFRVEDRYVRAVAKGTQGPVWQDSCVEFFFSPQGGKPGPYFNLEVNCGGTALMHYNITPRQDVRPLETADVEKIEIAHSLPRIVSPEITEPTVWTVEYRIPIAVLQKYGPCQRPRPGVRWRANFYKCGDETSNPHWLTWSPITNGKVDFHQPEFFGVLKFE